MPDIWMDVDTALAEVPVNLMPLIDDTTFKDIEGAVAYNAAGMALRWHFVTTGGSYTVTSVTPTTGGDYDWTDQGDSGVYTIEIPASGGASINNDTEGFGWFSGVATGVLPWRGPVIGFRAAIVNDALIDGGEFLRVDTRQFNGQNVTADSGRPEVNTTHWGGTAVASALVRGNLIQVEGTDATDYLEGLDNAVLSAVSTLQSTADDIETDTQDLQSRLGSPAGSISTYLETLIAEIGTAGDGLTAIPDVETLLTRLGAPADFGGGQSIAENLQDMAGATFSSSTDSLEAIRNRGDAAWTGGGEGGTDWTADERTAIRAILGIPGSGTTPDDPTTGILDTIRDLAATIDSEVGSIKTQTDQFVFTESGFVDCNVYRWRAGTPGNLDGNGFVPANVAAINGNTGRADELASWLDNEVLEDVYTDTQAIRNTLGSPAVSIAGDIAALNDISATDVWAAATRTLTALDEDTTTLDLDATIRAALGLASANLDTQLGDLPTAAENAAGLLDLANGVETGITLRQLNRAIGAVLAGLVSGAGTDTEVFKGIGQSSGGTTRVTVAADEDGNRTAVTLNL